jgi:hypothetical protein
MTAVAKVRITVEVTANPPVGALSEPVIVTREYELEEGALFDVDHIAGEARAAGYDVLLRLRRRDDALMAGCEL